MIRKITAPLDENVIRSLNAGDEILLSGIIFTGRDAAHKRLCSLIDKGDSLPVDLNGAVIYFVGPAPSKPGKVIGSAGPTTSYRMDSYSPLLIEKAALKGMIGKGQRSEKVKDSMKKHCAVYFAAIGGAGALMSKCIVKSEIVAYEDLGPEAIRRLEVVDMPLIVATDCYGNDLYETGPAGYSKE
ncbi:MAG: Fe-S-containing hydro-lyase [Spirochaetes bacterium]|nr:Fe-S-containing hydro-lyase [Spirochaetota bacterium]